jgi:hypothetical protein
MRLGPSTYKKFFSGISSNEFVRVSDINNNHNYTGSAYDIPRYDFTNNNGGWTTSPTSGTPFVWEPGRWYIVGNNNKQAILTSPSIPHNTYKVVVEHKWNFENILDHGKLQCSIDNGVNWVEIPSVLFSEGWYNTTNGWSGLQNKYIRSECLINLTGLPIGPGFKIRFVGIWNNSTLTPNPNWDISSVSIEGLGSVSYTYQITKYEITNNEYCLFLNSVDPAGTNPNSIYTAEMTSSATGGIQLLPSAPNGHKYMTKTNMGNKPVNFINWWRAARYCNWLYNGGNKYRKSDNTSIAPQNFGAYNIGTTTSGSTLFRPLSSRFRIPTLNEWIKAGYYMGDGENSGYWSYPTQKNITPECISIVTSGGDPIVSPTHSTFLSLDASIIQDFNLEILSSIYSDTMVRPIHNQIILNSQMYEDVLVETKDTGTMINSQMYGDVLVEPKDTGTMVNSQMYGDVLVVSS